MSEADLIWAAYCEVPRRYRTVKTFRQMTPEARQTWLAIAKRRLATGWVPAKPKKPEMKGKA